MLIEDRENFVGCLLFCEDNVHLYPTALLTINSGALCCTEPFRPPARPAINSVRA